MGQVPRSNAPVASRLAVVQATCWPCLLGPCFLGSRFWRGPFAVSVSLLLIAFGTAVANGQTETPLYFANNVDFKIPYNVGNAAADVVEVQLHYSLDKGNTWSMVARQSAPTGHFDFRAGAETEYLFGLRTIDRNQRAFPADRPRGEVRIRVDTTRPELEATLQADASGRIVTRVQARDAAIDPESVVIQYQLPTDRQQTPAAWQDVGPASLANELRSSPSFSPKFDSSQSDRYFQDQFAWWPQLPAVGSDAAFPLKLNVRVSIADLAGNRTDYVEEVLLDYAAYQKNLQLTTPAETSSSVGRPASVPPFGESIAATLDPQGSYAQPLQQSSKPIGSGVNTGRVTQPGPNRQTDPYSASLPQSNPPNRVTTAFPSGPLPPTSQPPVSTPYGDGQPPAHAGSAAAHPASLHQPPAAAPTRLASSASSTQDITAGSQPSGPAVVWASQAEPSTQNQTFQGSTLDSPPALPAVPSQLQNMSLPHTAPPEQRDSNPSPHANETRIGYQSSSSGPQPVPGNPDLVMSVGTTHPTIRDSRQTGGAGSGTVVQSPTDAANTVGSSGTFAGASGSPGQVPATLATHRPAHTRQQLLQMANPINSTKFLLTYGIDAIAPQDVEEVGLWLTADGGQSWRKWAVDADRQSPIAVSVDEPGIYGFRIVISGRDGLTSRLPSAGDPADMWVRVDNQKPQVEITSVPYGRGAQAGKLVVHWQAADEQLTLRPITLVYSDRPEGPWTTIEANLSNSGTYVWTVPAEAPPNVYLRIEARDTAGNVGRYLLAHAISLADLVPRGRIKALQPVSENSGK